MKPDTDEEDDGDRYGRDKRYRVEHFFPSVRDAWALPLSEFSHRLDYVEELLTEKSGGDTFMHRAMKQMVAG